MITIEKQKIKWQSNMTLAQLLGFLDGGHGYAVVRVNGKPVSRPNFSSTFVFPGDVVEPIPLIAGG